MLKIAGTAAIVVAVAVIVLLAYAATRPDTFRVVRSASIHAPPDRIFLLLEDLRRFTSWSPWEKRDPDMTRTFPGPANGKGAVYKSDGDRNVGQGRMEVVDASPPSRLVLKLDFVRPFPTHNIVHFALEPHGDDTTVIWSMQRRVPYLAKFLHLFVGMDRMVGGDFETGLANLKSAAER